MSDQEILALTRIADALETIIKMVSDERAEDAARDAAQIAEKEACPDWQRNRKGVCGYCGETHPPVSAGSVGYGKPQ